MTMLLVDLTTSGFYSVHSNYMYARENLVSFQDVCESPVEWGAFEGTFACEDVGD